MNRTIIFQNVVNGAQYLPVGGNAFTVGRSNAGDYKSLVDINATADFVHDF